MKSKSLESLRSELQAKENKLEGLLSEVESKKKTTNKLESDLRSNLRYILGGLIQTTEIVDKYPELIMDLYYMADTSDKMKFVSLGLVEDDISFLRRLNKAECKELAKQLDISTQLSERDLQSLEKIKNFYRDGDIAVRRQLYGSPGEIKVFIGENLPIYISDALAVVLRDHFGFFP
ncbi:hypothetical protein PQO01_07125 [Lentisphaera marina]|uniref:hypothetical protein n=1 Tax=Lentisphaera marina TaxID=1111041 RepID=UPI00236690AD|nr:hypothetical protein [Lentisphaera marina]MDD7984719.1 hypothetical protein [Lentisphaera marina]